MKQTQMSMAEAVEHGLRVRNFAYPTAGESAALWMAEAVPVVANAIVQAFMRLHDDAETAGKYLATAMAQLGIEVPQARKGADGA